MEVIYLDNASTTPMLPEVVEVMKQSMLNNFGNPSSTHQYGRKAKVAIETARKNIAKYFNASASEIIFTSGGTESNNLILQNAVTNLKVERIVTSKIEHHAVLNVVEYLQKTSNIAVDYVNLDEFGSVDLVHLESLLSETENKTLVSLMMINNEIGNILPIDNVCKICKKYKALFHSDTVQAIGHYELDLQNTPIDFITASAHKFHGPKGIGFAYFRKDFSVKSIFQGGNQEKGVRPGTENVHAILGMEKALQISYETMKEDFEYLTELKQYFVKQLSDKIKDLQFNGLSSKKKGSSCTILNVRFPLKDKMFLFNLDLSGLVVSAGSACQSGSNKRSHVLENLLDNEDIKKVSVRFSLNKFVTKEMLDVVMMRLCHNFDINKIVTKSENY